MEKDTEELMNELTLTKGLGEFIEENTDEFEELPLTELLAEMLRKYDKNRIDVIKAARLDFTYGYQIFDGKKSAGRDKLIQLAFGFPLSLEETQKLLRFGGHNELYVKKKREAFVMYALEKGYDINQVNDLLYQNEEETFE